jgi:hypothetical protein
VKFYNPWTDTLEEDTEEAIERYTSLSLMAAYASIFPLMTEADDDAEIEP